VTDYREETTSEQAAPERGRFVRANATVHATDARAPRTRHDVPRGVRPLLKPFFRYSYSRDAWVLLGVGSKRGPVIRDL
jgi:hypothetical protein